MFHKDSLPTSVSERESGSVSLNATERVPRGVIGSRGRKDPEEQPGGSGAEAVTAAWPTPYRIPDHDRGRTVPPNRCAHHKTRPPHHRSTCPRNSTNKGLRREGSFKLTKRQGLIPSMPTFS